MKRIIKNLIKSIVKKEQFILICAILICISSKDTYALTSVQYDRFVEDGRLGNLNIEVNAKGQMFRKFGHFIIDGHYSGGDKNPFYNAENSRDLAVLAVTEDSVYDVYGEIEYEEIDYSYEDDEELNATEYDRAAFQARVNGIEYGNTLKKSIGYGKYNLRPGKNLTAFIKFAYDFYKNNSGEVRVGCKNADDLISRGLSVDKICPMEELEVYAEKNYISTDTADDVDLKRIWKECTEKWEYEGSLITNKENIFEHLQDIFMCYVYLKPGIDKIKNTISMDTSKLDEADYGAILSMMYERFGGRPINPDKVESGNGIPVIGKGDVLAALVDLSNTELSHFSVADKIYTYMIEVKYKNNDLKLASWIKEAELVNGGYSILDAKDYDIYMKAYNEAIQKYGSDAANDTLLDYGCVLTPDIFESKKSFSDARNEFAKKIKKYFGDSSFYKNTGNENYVARSYMMAKKMCENSQFSDITDIYACDMDVVSHTYGYDSSNIILLADTQVVQLNDSYGQDCDTDQDGILDYKEAHTAEEVDIKSFLEVYCKYNKYSEEEKNEMLLKNSKVVMYNYSSNPVLPDSDFDGRDDLRDGRKLDNEYNSINETDNYSNVKIKFSQDYRYFFMESTQYYEELAEMGLVLSNMASKKKNNNNIYVNKKWTNNNSGEHYTANNINDFMWYIGMDNIVDHMEEEVPYIIGQHDTIGLLGKVNNLERNVITLVIGENEEYKNILAANYDGSLGSGSGNDIHHQGYDYFADKIYEQLINYDNKQNADRWKKSYWITGYGTGGAIANLVAKKFIDYKHVNTNVYCYTYQAPNTINRNNLTKRIANTKYQSIFNIENTDDIMLNLMGEETGWTKYGVLKRLSIGDNPKIKQSWNNLTGKQYKGGASFISNLFNGIFDFVNRIFGFSTADVGPKVSDDILEPVAREEGPEIMRAVIAEDIKSSNPNQSSNIINTVIDKPQITIKGAYISTKGKEVQKQAEDQTSNLNTSEAITIEQDTILSQEEEKKKKEKAKAQLLNSINEMGEWYVENVATYYSGGLQTQKYGPETSKDTALRDKSGNMYRWTRAYTDTKDIKLKYRDGVEKSYKMIILGDSGGADTPNIASDSTVVLRASNDAANNYKVNFDDVELDGTLGLNYYPCDKLEKGTDNYTKAGDDCVRFAFACFKNMDENFITDFKTYSGYNWNGVNTRSFAGKEDVDKNTPNSNNKNLKIAYAMSKLGFEIYDVDSSICTSYDMDGDGKDDFTIKNITNSFKLEATDFLAKSGHVHFSLDDETVVGKKKKNFGWGKVFREYPVKCTFWYNNGSHNNGYTRVYRYVGR